MSTILLYFDEKKSKHKRERNIHNKGKHAHTDVLIPPYSFRRSWTRNMPMTWLWFTSTSQSACLDALGFVKTRARSLMYRMALSFGHKQNLSPGSPRPRSISANVPSSLYSSYKINPLPQQKRKSWAECSALKKKNAARCLRYNKTARGKLREEGHVDAHSRVPRASAISPTLTMYYIPRIRLLDCQGKSRRRQAHHQLLDPIAAAVAVRLRLPEIRTVAR